MSDWEGDHSKCRARQQEEVDGQIHGVAPTGVVSANRGIINVINNGTLGTLICNVEYTIVSVIFN